MHMKSLDKGFSLTEMFIIVFVVCVLSYLASDMFIDQDSSQKRLRSRIELIDLRQSISTHLDCKQTLRPFNSCNGPVVLRRKNKKEIKLKKTSPYRLNAECKTDPITGEKSIIIGLLENKDPHAKGTKKDALIGKIRHKKRGKIIENDIFNGTSSFCSEYFKKSKDRNEPEWHYGGSYTLNTYQDGNQTELQNIDPIYFDSLDFSNFRTNNNPKVRPRCEKIFKDCDRDCGKKGDDCRPKYCPIIEKCTRQVCCGSDANGCNKWCPQKYECHADMIKRLKCYKNCDKQKDECKNSCQPSLNQCITSANGNQAKCRYPNPITGGCSCPSGSGVTEVKRQISWSMTNKNCDHGYYGDTTHYQGMPEKRITVGAGKSCFKFEVTDVNPTSFATGYTCNFDKTKCPDKSELHQTKIYNNPTRGPTRLAFAKELGNLCKDGAIMPGGLEGKWFGCGVTTITCYIKLKKY